MSKQDKDITQLIERLEVFEERAGVRLEAMSATLVGFYDHKTIHIYGELHPHTGSTIASNIDIMAAAYDADGKIVACRSERILADTFWGFTIFGIQVNDGAPISNLVKVRVYPQVTRPRGYADYV